MCESNIKRERVAIRDRRKNGRDQRGRERGTMCSQKCVNLLFLAITERNKVDDRPSNNDRILKFFKNQKLYPVKSFLNHFCCSYLKGTSRIDCVYDNYFIIKAVRKLNMLWPQKVVFLAPFSKCFLAALPINECRISTLLM